MSYDTKCRELAEYFLEDANQVLITDKVITRLAHTIQDVIEDFMQDGDNFPQPEPRWDTRGEWRHEAAEQQRFK